MKIERISFLLSFLIFIFASCKSENQYTVFSEVDNIISKFYTLKSTPKEGEWLFIHKEKYQGFGKYILSKPNKKDSTRSKIYVVRFGDFHKKENEIIDKTKEYIGAFYGLKVNEITLKNVDFFKNSRENRFGKQLFTPIVLNEILKPAVPNDAIALICLTNFDLYPNKDWNFVFGQATFKNRVGVWSMKRFGEPQKDSLTYKSALLRTVNTATHELGHMFSITHCTKFECCMNGSIGEAEHLSRPSYFCYECLDKVCWNTKISHQEHFEKIRDFWARERFMKNANFYQKNLDEVYSSNLK